MADSWLIGQKLLEADTFYLLAQEVCNQYIGKKSLTYAQILVKRSAIYRTLGRYKEGELLLGESKKIFDPFLQKRNPESIPFLLEIGLYCNQLSKYDTAEFYLLLSKGIAEENNLTDSYEYPSILIGLGSTYKSLLNIDKSIEYFEGALAHLKANSFNNTLSCGIVHSKFGRNICGAKQFCSG